MYIYMYIYVYIYINSPHIINQTKKIWETVPTQKTAIQDYKHKYKQNESSDQVHHKWMMLWLKYKHSMTTNRPKQSQNRTGELSTHSMFIKYSSQWRSLSKNKLVWRARVTLGSSKLNCSRQYVIISILLVRNNFIKNLFDIWCIHLRVHLSVLLYELHNK